MNKLTMMGTIAAGGLTLGVALAGCGSSGGGGNSAGGGSKTVVTIGYENAPDPEAVAIEQHFFQKYMNAKVRLT